MVIIKMKGPGLYNGVMFAKDETLEFTEEALEGLDKNDYDVVMTQKDIEAKAKADAKAEKAKADAEAKLKEEQEAEAEKALKNSSNKMQTPDKTK